jgi:hypothetical protein
MDLHNETPLLTAKVSNGGSAIDRVLTPSNDYRIRHISARELAAIYLGRKFNLSPQLAAVVSELAQLGGRS